MKDKSKWKVTKKLCKKNRSISKLTKWQKSIVSWILQVIGSLKCLLLYVMRWHILTAVISVYICQNFSLLILTWKKYFKDIIFFYFKNGENRSKKWKRSMQFMEKVLWIKYDKNGLWRFLLEISSTLLLNIQNQPVVVNHDQIKKLFENNQYNAGVS